MCYIVESYSSYVLDIRVKEYTVAMVTWGIGSYVILHHHCHLGWGHHGGLRLFQAENT